MRSLNRHDTTVKFTFRLSGLLIFPQVFTWFTNMEALRDREVAERIRQKEIENGRLLVERTSAGDLDGVKELLSNGAQPNADAYSRTLYYELKNYWSPLHHAAYIGHHEIAELLIAGGGMSTGS